MELSPNLFFTPATMPETILPVIAPKLANVDDQRRK